MNAYLRGVQYFLPEGRRSNADLVALNPTWDADDLFRKTGIRNRPIAAPEQTAADLARLAAERLLTELNFDRQRIDALIFCTQSPDHFLPTTACILQEKLGLPTTCGAFDVNLGCSAFTYGLWMARSLILSESATNVLLLVGDTLTRYCNPHDSVTAPIFADGAGAALITSEEQGSLAEIGPSIVGTEGRGASHLIVPAGASRQPRTTETAVAKTDESGNMRSADNLYMNGPEVFSFTLSSIKTGIDQLLEKVHQTWDDIDLFLLHQANGFILQSLRRKLRVPPEKLPIEMEQIGNTTSASIPILLRQCQEQGRFKPGAKCVLAGFGVGYSWAMTYLQWKA